MTSLANTSLFCAVSSDTHAEKKNIFRAQHNKENPYTLISNKVLRDERIRHSDRGILCQLLSWSDSHRLCIQALVKKSIEGRDAIRNSIDRLIKSGYIIMNRIKNNNGQFDTVTYKIFEEPQGVVKAELDLTGIVEEESNWMQLELFSDEEGNVVINQSNNDSKTKNVNCATSGLSEDGKHDTNNNYVERNTYINNKQNDEIPIVDGKVNKAELLNRFRLDFNDPILKAKIGMAGLSTFLVSQEQLDHFLIDFNQQHYNYSNISNTKRIYNFVAYLVRMKSNPHFYKTHIIRMQALGFYSKNSNDHKKILKQNKVKKQQRNINPFDVVIQKEPVSLRQEYLNSLEDF
ncbi:hypothetical protein [Acinetobacter bereziniae]|uniref:hypothetical protein n=1 Tax=Acinetobacter bereziniae TaxID=106648 RepID=UPI001250B289|nr:hypothetical protein [Acinetobacter bereziniae]